MQRPQPSTSSYDDLDLKYQKGRSMNPFRSSASSQAQETTVASSSSPLPPLPPRVLTSSRNATPPNAASVPTIMENLPDDDDVPPPYTPAANMSIGEETIGLGPRRPFQPAPSAPSSLLNPSSQSRPRPNHAPPPTARPHLYPNGPGPSSDPGYYMPSAPPPGPAPWQTQQQYHRPRPHGGGGLIGALIDTVRDIADAVSGTTDERVAVQQANSAAYAPSYRASYPSSYDSSYATPYSNTRSVSGYAPLAGPPLPPRPASTPPDSSVPDDGSPTRKPVPGHPLLRNGKLLVYPKDYVCVKCKNIGYKNYDPFHPCRKCWDKYGKPYTGALSYTRWSASGNDPRMQRPLPKFDPPHLAGGSHPGSLYLPPPQHPHHSRSISQPNHHYTGSGPSYFVRNPFTPDATPPVLHAIPVEPGDPRLGGRLCMRCGGDGYRTVMLIDVMMCDECGGTGRIWR